MFLVRIDWLLLNQCMEVVQVDQFSLLILQNLENLANCFYFTKDFVGSHLSLPYWNWLGERLVSFIYRLSVVAAELELLIACFIVSTGQSLVS